jgi:hypothetical protein
VSSRQRWDPSIRLHLFSLSLARTLFFPYCIDFTTSPLLASLSRTLVLVSLLFAFAYFFRFFLNSFYNFFFRIRFIYLHISCSFLPSSSEPFCPVWPSDPSPSEQTPQFSSYVATPSHHQTTLQSSTTASSTSSPHVSRVRALRAWAMRANAPGCRRAASVLSDWLPKSIEERGRAEGEKKEGGRR